MLLVLVVLNRGRVLDCYVTAVSAEFCSVCLVDTFTNFGGMLILLGAAHADFARVGVPIFHTGASYSS